MPSASPRRARGQAIVELALVMPLMVGIATVLLQFGILFISYLSMIHATRDLGRWLAVHPDTTDTQARAHVLANLPSVVDPARVTVTLAPTCASLSSGRCSGRPNSSAQRITLAYDASTQIFLPTQFRLGPWLNTSVPTALPAYDYFVMVESR